MIFLRGKILKQCNFFNDHEFHVNFSFLGSTSVWLTVSFTVERYIAVCHPIKGKVFCTERRAKSVIVIVYIFCILTTASTTFEYQLNLNETCIEECELDVKRPVYNPPNNGTDNHFITNHTLMFSANFPYGSIASRPKFDEKHFKKLKLIILSNCELQPCIIYVPPLSLNVSKDKIMNPNIIVKELDTEGAVMVSKIQETLEPVLEKPPSEAEFVDNSTDSINKTCCVKHYTIEEGSTTLGRNDTYLSIIYWYSSLCFYLIPLALIATFNSFLVRTVYLSQRVRRQMTNSQVK